jgi:hypothetical protein
MKNSTLLRRSILLLFGAGALGAMSCSEDTDTVKAVVTAQQCLEVRTSMDLSDGTTPGYTRKTWDPAQRILVSQYSTSPTFDKIDTLQWRYASDGRIISYLGVEQPFQQDLVYDDHDNMTSFRLSYPDKPDLLVPSTAQPWIEYLYANEYAPSGRLAASTLTQAGGGANGQPGKRFTYTEDDAGRCSTVIATTGDQIVTETRTYDQAGRLSKVEHSAPWATSQTMTYDDQNRLATSTYTAINDFHPGTVTTTHTYGSDGSETVTIDDEMTDVSSERHVTITRTAACLTIDDAIGIAPDAHCRVH